MAINQNHIFEELDGVKCGIVEKHVSGERVAFLKTILEYNGFSVIVVPSPPPKAAVPVKPVAGAAEAPVQAALASPLPETYIVGVTDVMFNPVNAVFGRLLKLPGGHVVTLAYWQQKEKQSLDEIPYFDVRQ